MLGRGLRQGRLLQVAEHNRKGFLNLVWIQKSSLYGEADSILKNKSSLLILLLHLFLLIYPPVCFKKGLMQVSFSSEERMDNEKEPGPSPPGQGDGEPSWRNM